MSTIKNISIKDATSTSGYDTREIGTDAVNVDVQFDADGNIITNPSTQTADPSKDKSLAEVLATQAPKAHASSTSEFGAASTSQYGHVKVGTGLDVTDGEVSVKYGTETNTAVEGNDSRLSDARKNPNALTFADGTSYDGSAAKSVDASSLNAAPSAHAESTGKYGIGNQTNFGHVKVSDVYNTSLGTASTGMAASQDAVYEVYQLALAGSSSAGRELTKAEYDALTEEEKTDGTIYFVTDWNSGEGGGGSAGILISWEDYQALSDEQKESSTEWFVYDYPDENLLDATQIAYDNEESELEAETVQEAIDELKKSVSDGKSSLAAAITSAGVTTAADATFETMKTNVGTVATNKYNAGVSATKKGTATAAQVLTGYTFTNSTDVEASGSMANRGSLTKTITPSSSKQTFNYDSGYYSGGTITCEAGGASTPTLASASGSVSVGGSYTVLGESGGGLGGNTGGMSIKISSWDPTTRKLVITGSGSTSSGGSIEYIGVSYSGSSSFSATIQL